jgi:phosphoserine phosphatase RsbU/P
MLFQTKEKSFSFGATLISIFIILIVTTAGLIGYVSFLNGQKAAKNLANQIEDSIQARVEHDLNTFLAKPHALNQINAAAIRSGLVSPRDLVGLRTRFFHQIQAFDSVMTCAFGSEVGEFASAGRRSEGGFDSAIADKRLDNDYRVYLLDDQGEPTEVDTVVQDYYPQQRSWYQAGIHANGPTWSPIYVWASQSNMGLSAVLPVYDKAGKLLGVQLSALSLGYIGQFLQNIRLANTGQIFIIERSGLLVASSLAEPLLQENRSESEVGLERVSATNSTNPLIRETANYLNEQFTNLDQISNQQRLEMAVEGQKYFLSVAPFVDEYGLDWLVIIAIPEADLMGTAEANTRTTILVGLIILAGTLILGIKITQRITHPILQLNQATQEMSRGKWEKIETNTRLKEVRQLTNSFNQMARQLSETFETLEQRVRERTNELAGVNKQLQLEIAEHKKTEIDRERLIIELQKALENVKMLSGLLPMCANCKKIRDDDGNWHDVVAYVRDHSEAEFSHGICPDCMTKLYPEFYGDKG